MGVQELNRQLKERHQKIKRGKKSRADIDKLRQLLLALKREEPQEEESADQSRMSHDPKIHIAKSTFDLDNPDTGEHAMHSKQGYRERLNQKIDLQLSKKNKRIQAERKQTACELRTSGLFPCDEEEPHTCSQCIAGPFHSAYHLQKHKQFGEHVYPSLNLISHATAKAVSGEYAFCLALGSMTNKDRVLSPPFEAKEPSLEFPSNKRVWNHCFNAGCYRRDCKAWKTKKIQASPELTKDVRALFDEGENRSSGGEKRNAAKYTPVEAAAVLHEMMDGARRKYRTGGPYGNLPDNPSEYIQRKFAEWARKGAKGLNDVATDSRKGMTIKDLKSLYEERFKESATDTNILKQILEIDDEMKHREGQNALYNDLNLEELKAECKQRDLECDKTKVMLLTVHHAFEEKEEVNSRRREKDYQNALRLTEASTVHYEITHDL